MFLRMFKLLRILLYHRKKLLKYGRVDQNFFKRSPFLFSLFEEEKSKNLKNLNILALILEIYRNET